MDEDDLRHEVCKIEQVPGLYITDWVGAASVNEANILGITHILSILSAEELERYGPDETKGVELRHLDVKDEPSSDISQYFQQECDWLDSVLAKPGAGVIVHCQQGVSRSVAIVMAYLMKKHGLSFQEALQQVKQTRSIVNLNPGFVLQLQEWQRKLRSPKLNVQAVDSQPKNGFSSPIDVITPVDVIDFVEGKE